MNMINPPIDLLTKENIENEDACKAIAEYGCDNWISVLDHEDLSLSSRKHLLQMTHNCSSQIPLIIRLSSQNIFGAIIANEITNTEKWDELNKILKEANLKSAANKNQIEKGLAELLSRKDIFFWFFGLIFSKSFFRATKKIVYDGESDLRIESLKYLSYHNGESILKAIYNALDDTDKKVIETAKRIIREKYGDEDLNSYIEEENSRLKYLQDLASTAKQSIFEVFKKIPGLDSISNAFSRISTSIENLTDNTKKSIKDKFSSLKGKLSSHNEQTDKS